MDNKTSIENCENLILDVRDNGGGTDGAYKELLPLIATNPIRSNGIELLCTQDLIDGVTNYKNGLIKNNAVKNNSEIKKLDSLINIYEINIGNL